MELLEKEAGRCVTPGNLPSLQFRLYGWVARSAIEGGSEVTTKTPEELVTATGQTIEVVFLYLDLTTCSRCRGSDASLHAALESVPSRSAPKKTPEPAFSLAGNL